MDHIDSFKIINLATELHNGQYRKHAIEGYKLPYVFHAFDVAKRLWRWGISDPIMQSAALLHDTIEDAETEEHADNARLRIKTVAGIDVLNLVEELTCYGDKIEYMSSFKNKSLEAIVIKIADRLCNVEDFMQSSPGYTKKYLDKAIELFDAFYSKESKVTLKFNKSIYSKIKRDITRICLNIYVGDF